MVVEKLEEVSSFLKDNFFFKLNCYTELCQSLDALIAGSTGYIGIQLVKLLLKHKNVKIKFLCGNTSKGKSISYFDKSIKNKNLTKNYQI